MLTPNMPACAILYTVSTRELDYQLKRLDIVADEVYKRFDYIPENLRKAEAIKELTPAQEKRLRKALCGYINNPSATDETINDALRQFHNNVNQLEFYIDKLIDEGKRFGIKIPKPYAPASSRKS
jgi:hypothetical protein